MHGSASDHFIKVRTTTIVSKADTQGDTFLPNFNLTRSSFVFRGIFKNMVLLDITIHKRID